jgi:hypothetical protein
MWISPPVIGRLAAKPRLWARRRLRRGDFGPTQRKGRVWFAQLGGVERRLGVTFTPEQVAAALKKQEN